MHRLIEFKYVFKFQKLYFPMLYLWTDEINPKVQAKGIHC